MREVGNGRITLEGEITALFPEKKFGFITPCNDDDPIYFSLRDLAPNIHDGPVQFTLIKIGSNRRAIHIRNLSNTGQ